MHIKLFDKILDEWSLQWNIFFFVGGSAILSIIFYQTTQHTAWDIFDLIVCIIGLACVCALTLRKNLSANGLGIITSAGDVISQGRHGAIGLMLFPLYAIITHIFALFSWSQNTDQDGNVTTQSSSVMTWVVTVIFIAIGLYFFPIVNDYLIGLGYGITAHDDRQVLGISFYWLNVIAFVLSMTAQTSMMLRYSFSWGLWIICGFIWIIINVMSGYSIFAVKIVIYEVNALLGLYAWSRDN